MKFSRFSVIGLFYSPASVLASLRSLTTHLPNSMRRFRKYHIITLRTAVSPLLIWEVGICVRVISRSVLFVISLLEERVYIGARS